MLAIVLANVFDCFFIILLQRRLTRIINFSYDNQLMNIQTFASRETQISSRGRKIMSRETRIASRETRDAIRDCQVSFERYCNIPIKITKSRSMASAFLRSSFEIESEQSIPIPLTRRVQ